MVYGDGLFLMVAGRASEYTTSAEVNSLPSWNCTPGRSLSSHTVSLTARQEIARPGRMRILSSLATSVSNRCSATFALGVTLWKCGSSEVMSPDRPTTSVDGGCAWAVAGASAMARDSVATALAARSRRRTSMTTPRNVKTCSSARGIVGTGRHRCQCW